MHASGMRGLLAELSSEALRFVPGSRIEQTARQWLARGGLPEDDLRGLLVMADAIGFASDLALFTPSPSGAIAVDRLLRNRPVAGEDEAAAAEALRRAHWRGTGRGDAPIGPRSSPTPTTSSSSAAAMRRRRWRGRGR
jgi:hypothetical protein